MQNQRNKEELETLAREEGAQLFGVALLGEEIKAKFFLTPPEVFADLIWGVVVGIRLSQKVLQTVTNAPSLLYLHHYRQLNYFLDRLALKIAGFIQDKGYLSLPIPASQIIDWENQCGHLSHKELGRQAGLGWIGRNNLLINPAFGAQVRYVSILTNYPLVPGKPRLADCGSCQKCLPVCPAGAIRENPADFDHLACYTQLREFAKKGGQQICGICVKACGGRKE